MFIGLPRVGISGFVAKEMDRAGFSEFFCGGVAPAILISVPFPVTRDDFLLKTGRAIKGHTGNVKVKIIIKILSLERPFYNPIYSAPSFRRR